MEVPAGSKSECKTVFCLQYNRINRGLWECLVVHLMAVEICTLEQICTRIYLHVLFELLYVYFYLWLRKFHRDENISNIAISRLWFFFCHDMMIKLQIIIIANQ